MALQTAIKKIKDAKKQYDSALAALGRKDITKALGEVIPGGFVLVWTQYTPGFNDGEPCTWRLGEVSLLSAFEPKTGSEETASEPTDDGDVAGPDDTAEAEDELVERTNFDDGTCDEQGFSRYTEAADLKAAGLTKKTVNDVFAVFETIPREALKKAFGDGARIIVRAGGKHEIHEYDCGY